MDEIVLRLEEEGRIEVDFDEEIGEGGEVKRFRNDWRRDDDEEAFDAKMDEVEQVVDDAIYSSLGMTKMMNDEWGNKKGGKEKTREGRKISDRTARWRAKKKEVGVLGLGEEALHKG